MTLRLGILLPESGYIPRFAKGYLHALKTGFAEQGVTSFELHIEHCGYNADSGELARKASKLAIEQDVHAVIAPLNPSMAGRIKSPFIDYGIPLIATHQGENFLHPDEKFDGLLMHGANEWLCNWMTGFWASRNLGKKSFSYSSFHEAGYPLLSAFMQGVQTAGGVLTGSAVTRDQNYAELFWEKEAEQPDFLAAFYSGKEGLSFLQHLKDGAFRDTPLIANHAMLTPEILAQVGESACGIHSVAIWDIDEVSPESREFLSGFQRAIGRSPDIHALLAYESALMMGAALQDAGDALLSPGQFKPCLTELQMVGPRGALAFETSRPNEASLFKVVSDGKGGVKNRKIQNLEIPELFWTQYESARMNPIRSGWVNPYLIA